jgi:hypothetical protein
MRRMMLATLLMSLPMLPSSAWADNSTSAAPYSIMPAGAPVEDFLNNTSTQKWYFFTAVLGRSYCVETQAGPNNLVGVANPGLVDTILDVFRSDGTTLIVHNDDSDNEPFGRNLSRACYIAPASDDNLIRVTRFNATADFVFFLQVSETTMFSPSWTTNTPFITFWSFQNTTEFPIGGTLTLVNPAGATVTTSAVTIPGDGQVGRNTSTMGVAPNQVGVARFVHNGPPGGVLIKANQANFSTSPPFIEIFPFEAVRVAR